MKELQRAIEVSSVKQKFETLLGKKSPGFLSSLLQTVNNNSLLQKADVQTILAAAATAASLDLPINQSLGYAYIVPYKGSAQFQIGWKGYVQLAQRTGQYQAINALPVYANQFKSYNSLTEHLDADFSIEGEGEVVGYAAYFRLINGFEKTVYRPKDKIVAHAKKYSKSYGDKYSAWTTSFDEMGCKTVLKSALSKYGILSIEMQTAVLADQSVQRSEGNYEYPDNTISLDEISEQKEIQRVLEWIDKADSQDHIDMVLDSYTGELTDEIKEAIKSMGYEIN